MATCGDTLLDYFKTAEQKVITYQVNPKLLLVTGFQGLPEKVSHSAMLSTFLFLATCLQKLKYPELIPVTYPQARDLEWHKPQFAQTAQQRTIELQHWTAFEVEDPDGTSVTVAVPPPPPVPTFVCAPVAGEVMQAS